MSTSTLSETIKVRIPEVWKTQLEGHAEREGLNVSDIGRRAVREFLERNRHRKSAKSAR